jgi:enamine deaminase RidA (YjgF/YER057c/UK114 family)
MPLLCDPATLPTPPKPAGAYVPVVLAQGMAYTAGMLPLHQGQLTHTGPVTEATVPNGQDAAQLAMLNALAALQAALGDLNRVTRVVKLTGFVHAASGFGQHPQVMNAASAVLTEWFGPDVGSHARSAVGVASLPLNAMVELELVVAYE